MLQKPSMPHWLLVVQLFPPTQYVTQSGSELQEVSQTPSELQEDDAGQALVAPLHVTLPLPAPLAEQAPEVPLHARDDPSAHWMLTEQSLATSADLLVSRFWPESTSSLC